MNNPELRKDLVSGDWIVNAPGRLRRPHQFISKQPKRKRAPKSGCPFEDPQKSGNNPPILLYPNSHKWAVQIIENKYPVVIHKKTCGVLGRKGPYDIFPAIGHHDIVITKDHDKNFPKLSTEQANLTFQAFRDRYLMIYNDQCIEYVSILHNWGPAAGASVYHPHYQMIAIPVVPPDVSHSLEGSARFFKANDKCVHCVMIDWEKKEKKRIIFENEGAIAFAPFVSRSPFEVRVFPKKHLSYFENTYDHDIASVVEALQVALRSFQRNLKDPDYNFFIHTAPLKNKEKYGHYHWHIEAFPRLVLRAGFEFGTGVEINIIDPELAAQTLSHT